MTRHKRNEFSAKQFSERFTSALENNPNAPPKFQGERVWLSEQLLKRGISVTPETVRKWLNGVAMPTHDKVPQLADLLGVDADWLLYGAQVAENAVKRVQHSVDAAGATNLLAGIIQLNGGDARFPAERAKGSAHLHAVIDRVSYPMHVVVGERMGDEVEFVVPKDASDSIVIGIVQHEGAFAFDVYEIDEDLLIDAEVRHGGRVVTVKPSALRQIRSFSERL